MIGRLRPLIKTLRFEAKRGYFKSLFNLYKNRQNVFQSMTKNTNRWCFFIMLRIICQITRNHTWKSRGSSRVFKGPIQAVIRESICLHDTDLITKGYTIQSSIDSGIIQGRHYYQGLTMISICLVLLIVLLCIKLKFIHLLKKWKPCLIIFTPMHMK